MCVSVCKCELLFFCGTKFVLCTRKSCLGFHTPHPRLGNPLNPALNPIRSSKFASEYITNCVRPGPKRNPMAPKKKKGEAFRTLSRVSRAACVCERISLEKLRVCAVRRLYTRVKSALSKNLNSLFGCVRVRAARRRRQNFFPKHKD